MNRTIVIAFSTVDGIIEDPDGTSGTPNGGWAFRHGPEAVAVRRPAASRRQAEDRARCHRRRQRQRRTAPCRPSVRPFWCATSVTSSDGDHAGLDEDARLTMFRGSRERSNDSCRHP
jgi:hypothetical protein